MNENIIFNPKTGKKARIISNNQIAYDLLELQDMLLLPMDTCLNLLCHNLSTNMIDATC